MAIHVCKSKQFDEKIGCLTDKSVHYLPCKVHFDGSANVSKYFSNLITGGENDLQVSFRGYPLNGRVVRLPVGYKGIVLQEPTKPINGCERTFHVTRTFDSLTYWNWDKIPSKDDTFISSLDWIDIAEAIHSPVDEKSEV